MNVASLLWFPWSRRAGGYTDLSRACCVPCTEVRSLSSKSRETTHFLTGTNNIEALEILRERYNAQHYGLRKFYYECSNLKYLTGLINVPKLGQVGNTSSKLHILPG